MYISNQTAASGSVSENFTAKVQKQGEDKPVLSADEIRKIAIKTIIKSRAAASKSDHHKYMVGSTIYKISSQGNKKYISLANRIPRKLKKPRAGKPQGFTSHDHIGEGNPTVHGEFRGLYTSGEAAYTFLGCNTPLCANCLKSAIMRKVDAIFIDAKSLPGFKTEEDSVNPWTKDRAQLWNDLCLPMIHAAKIPVYSVNPETNEMTAIEIGLPPAGRPLPQHPARIMTAQQITFAENDPQTFLNATDGSRRAIAVARDIKTGEERYIFAQDSNPPGFSEEDGSAMAAKFAGAHTRFHFTLDPAIQLAMKAAEMGLKLENSKIYTNWIPSSGRQLDLAYIGITQIHYTQNHLPPTQDALDALRTLSEARVISYHTVAEEQSVTKILQENFKSDTIAPSIT